MAKLNKQPIRDFMQKHYTDERLAWLLAHCRDEKFSFNSCCCFIGIATSDHDLRGSVFSDGRCAGTHAEHYKKAIRFSRAAAAEKAVRFLYENALDEDRRAMEGDPLRRRVLIPMIRAEMWRRAKLRKVTMAAELNQPASPIQSVQDSSLFTKPEHAEKLNKLEQDVAK